METVLTSQALWQDYDPEKEPLETNVLKCEEVDGIVEKTLYFTGRTVEDGKSRVFAKVCHKAGKKCKNAVLLVENYKKPINLAELRFWAANGFVAIAIDFAGRSTKGPSTLYPSSLDYCNSDVARSYFYVGNNARQTKIYEYALNCMRAVTYLVQEEKATEISVITVKKGTSVGIVVLGTDKRVTNGTVIFGSLYREYFASENDAQTVKDLDDEELAQHLAFEEKRQIWEAGISPQSYAIQTKVPVYLVVAANSSHVGSLNSNKTYYRLNDDSRMLVVPLSIDYMPEEHIKSVINWCKGQIPAEDMDLQPLKTEKGDNFVKLTSALPLSKLELWYSRNPDSRSRNWVKANLKAADGYYYAELDCYRPQGKITAFAVAKGAVNISTAFCEVEVNAPSSVKTPTRRIFSGDGSGFMLPYVVGSGFHGTKNQVVYCNGYLDIRGAKSSSMATFVINDPCVRHNEIFTVSFDVCCNTPQVLTTYAVSDFGGQNEVFLQSVQLSGDGKWQRITLDGEAFQGMDGRQMPEEQSIEMLCFVAESEFIINNIFLV